MAASAESALFASFRHVCLEPFPEIGAALERLEQSGFVTTARPESDIGRPSLLLFTRVEFLVRDKDGLAARLGELDLGTQDGTGASIAECAIAGGTADAATLEQELGIAMREVFPDAALSIAVPRDPAHVYFQVARENATFQVTLDRDSDTPDAHAALMISTFGSHMPAAQ